MKLCRFMAPAKPLPLDTAIASTALTRSESPGVELLPHLVSVRVVDPQLDQLLPGLDPGGFEVAVLGLRQGPRLADSPCDLERRVPLVLRRLDPHHPDGRDPERRSRARHGSGRPRPVSCRLSRRRSPSSPRLRGPSVLLPPRKRGRQARGGPTARSHVNAPPGDPSGALTRLCPKVPAGMTRRALRDVEKSKAGPKRPGWRRYTK